MILVKAKQLAAEFVAGVKQGLPFGIAISLALIVYLWVLN